MAAKGWISLHRKIQECFLWGNDEPFDRRSAWIDLLLLANHKDAKTMFDGKPITVKEGQRITSIRILAQRWGWSTKKTTNFLKVLESENMIVKQSDRKKTLLTIVNYSIYQDVGNSEETQKKHSGNTEETLRKHRLPTNNNENNENNDNNENKYIEVSSLRSDTSCGEPDKPPQPQEPVFIKLPLNDKTEFDVTEKMVAEYKELYPAVDVEQELRNMRGWCLSNPQKRKTRRGAPSFINNWLQKTQNSGRYNKPQYPRPTDQQQRIDAMSELTKQLEAKGE